MRSRERVEGVPDCEKPDREKFEYASIINAADKAVMTFLLSGTPVENILAMINAVNS
jgi:hypothetical protein